MKKKTDKRRLGAMDIVLIVVALALVSFTVTMIAIFRERGAVPDTLVTCVFACLGGECGVMGWIKTTKDKYQDRRWRKEDEKTSGKGEKT